ncbi:MAG: hypothetical protein MJ119_03260 [Lachnospiraceae bacterium]|nr:hypothetical protein [Lachnospiraceae bacterium]
MKKNLIISIVSLGIAVLIMVIFIVSGFVFGPSREERFIEKMEKVCLAGDLGAFSEMCCPTYTDTTNNNIASIRNKYVGAKVNFMFSAVEPVDAANDIYEMYFTVYDPINLTSENYYMEVHLVGEDTVIPLNRKYEIIFR